MEKLRKSPVVFEQGPHKYYLGDKELEGVTTLMTHQLFPEKYKDVPEFIMKNSQDIGTMVHEQCELADGLGVVPTMIQAKNYVRMKEEMGLKHVDSEYLVSDEDSVASSIDKVFEGDGEDEYRLADIKTTAHFDDVSVAWQLSIYAYLFEKQNPGAKVTELFGIWLRNEICEKKVVKRIDDEEIKKLIQCEKDGKKYSECGGIVPQTINVPANVLEVQAVIIEIEKKSKEMAEKKKELTEALMAQMEENGVVKWETDKMIITRVLPTTKKDFDKKAMEKCYPEIYAKYLKETPVKGSIRIKVKD